MKKPWSITTTLRNPERLRDFLIVLSEMEGQEWSLDAQKKYQILLIKNRKYGYGNSQFYNGLSNRQIQLIEDIKQEMSFEQAEDIFHAKGYEDPAMRGRQSINPLKKLGLVSVKVDKIFITDLGRLLLGEDYDLGEMFFRSFLKWQIPNPDNDDYKKEDGYDIKPFVGTLQLIKAVNLKSQDNKDVTKGISKQEFSLFVPTLINYKDIERYASKIISLRGKMRRKTKTEQKKIFDQYRKAFAQDFLGTKKEDEVNGLLNNLKDYGDNAVRYFRLTRFLHVRGGGYYIDLEPRRRVEIENLLAFDNGASLSFSSREEYLAYIADISMPKLPWETVGNLIKIVDELVKDIGNYERDLAIPNKRIESYGRLDESSLKRLIGELRDYRRQLQEQEDHITSQNMEAISSYINTLENIFEETDSAIALEKYAALALHALNDALKIQPNYPVGDDNEPTFTAPAGKPDIECYYDSFNAICEVTMLTGRNQWYNEGQPVMRHLRDFEDKNKGKHAYCVFVAPRIHRDTLNTFWISIKYEYEGCAQRIIPLSIKSFIDLLKTLVQIKEKGKPFSHMELSKLYDSIIAASEDVGDANQWVQKIPGLIDAWQKCLTA